VCLTSLFLSKLTPVPQNSPSGTLFVCATPLGHLDDVSPRLLQTLRDAALICAEDTRHTQKLLSRLRNRNFFHFD
jgi:16S rRNA C1402 (ribose-2'-O) methylase RsmI